MNASLPLLLASVTTFLALTGGRAQAQCAAGDSTEPAFSPAMETLYEVPIGTTEVTIVGMAFDDSALVSATIGGQAAVLTQSGEVATATITVSGPDPVWVPVVFTDACGNAASQSVEVRFVAVCAPAFDVCADGNVGTVFWLDLVSPSGAACRLRCATDAYGTGLACDTQPICSP